MVRAARRAVEVRRVLPFAIPWQARLVLLAAIWGMSFLFIKIGDQALSPLQVALGRLLCGTVTLLLILLLRRERLPSGSRVWLHLSVVALLSNVLPFTLFAYGETTVTSVLAGIWNATTPLATLLVAMLTLPEERPTANRVAGLVVGFVGVMVVLGIWRGLGGHALLGNLACLTAACCYGLAFPYTRKYLSGRGESVLALAAGQLLCGTLLLGVLTPILAGVPTDLSAGPIAAIVTLGALGTGIAYILNYSLVRDAGATGASTVTYLIPLFSTLAGLIFLSERLTWNQPVGALIVILGIAVSQGRLGPVRRSRAAI